MNGIESAFTGRLGNAPVLKTSKKSGKPWCSLNVAVGEGASTQWVRVAAFGEMAETAIDFPRAAGTNQPDPASTKRETE